jgi:cysteine desulfurase
LKDTKFPALFMTDATQAVGKIAVDVTELKIDFLVLSGHKFYAPKGIGALYHSRNAEMYLAPLIHGGGHENGLRSGTLNTAGIVGLGKASEIALKELNNNDIYTKSLRDLLESELLKIDGASINGSSEKRIFNVSNLCFQNIESDVLIGKLNNIAFSNGSACSSSIVETSHVLRAMKLSPEQANSSIRLSLGKFNTKEEIEYAATELKSAIKNLQLVSK